MVAEFVALALFVSMVIAEAIHGNRVRKIAPLAFGPQQNPRSWTKLVAPLRVLTVAGIGWALTSLLFVPPKSYRPEGQVQPGKEQHILIVLDVSPSMRLEDAGPTKKQSRKDRARDLMRSFFDRIPVDQYLVSVIAVYSGAKPVVVDSRDLDVVDGILGDLPLYQAFDVGETRLLEGIRAACELAKPWNPGSTTMILLSDGDSVPPQGMPPLPASVGNVLVFGVGDPNQGSFIAGRQSKQDAFTLRQIANRLKGSYHDGNAKHLPSNIVETIIRDGSDNQKEPWSRREYALLVLAICGPILALLPWLLERFGTNFLPGIRRSSETSRNQKNSRPILADRL